MTRAAIAGGSNPLRKPPSRKIRPPHLTYRGFCLAARDGDYPFLEFPNPSFERRKQGWQKEPVLSPSPVFVVRSVDSARSARSQGLPKRDLTAAPIQEPRDARFAQRGPSGHLRAKVFG